MTNKKQRFDENELIGHDNCNYNIKHMIDYYVNEYKKLKNKFNHKIYRNIVKKVKRKLVRQKNGKLRDSLIANYDENVTGDEETEEQLEEERLKREKEDKLWLEREKLAQIEFKAKKDREKRELEKKKQEEDLIRQELERVKNEMLIKKNNPKSTGKNTSSNNVNKSEQKNNAEIENRPTHNPIMIIEERKECMFYKRTGVCKYGYRCNREHNLCVISKTLLFQNMYINPKLWYDSIKSDYDCDFLLEYEDKEIYNHFRQFYYDVLAEFKRIGRVIQFKVCCNYQSHLRGNVYVQFEREDDAIKAYSSFNGRYYGGKQLSACFVSINNWKESICGLFLRKSCDKGRECNYLHIFKDPDSEFRPSKHQITDSHSKIAFEDNQWSPVSKRATNSNGKENDKSKNKPSKKKKHSSTDDNSDYERKHSSKKQKRERSHSHHRHKSKKRKEKYD